MLLTELYILIENYDESHIRYFEDNYLVGFEEQSDYYEFPMEFNASTIFETAEYKEMMAYVIKGKLPYRFYFASKEVSEIKGGMIFFNQDKSLIFGLRLQNDDTLIYEERMKSDFDSDKLMLTTEIDPPDNIDDFIASIT